MSGGDARGARPWLAAGVWLVLLAVLGAFVATHLHIGADLRLFMPSPTTPAQRVLIEEIGEGPGSRLLLVALDGDDAAALAATSSRLVARLREDPRFAFAANGEGDADALPDALLPYRYLLSPTLDHARLDADFLHAELRARARDLASPASSALRPWLPRDPTLAVRARGERWQPASEPPMRHGVWFDADGERALLVAETAAPGFDPDAQAQALDALRAHLDAAREDAPQHLVASGPGAFAVLMKSRTQAEASTLGAVATAGLLALLLFAYRSPRLLLLGALPLAGAALAGLAAVSVLFGAVHGITLAFGFTLIGVAQDYPMHLFSHQRAGVPPARVARAIWPTLAAGVASTCIAYLAFLASGVVGLAQLACFAIAGLLAAALATRWLLPPLIPAGLADRAASPRLERLRVRLLALPRLGLAAWIAAGVAAAAVLLSPRPLWENDLSALTPVPRVLIEQDVALRRALGAPDVRWLLVLSADGVDMALARAEALSPELDRLVEAGAIAGYDHAARYVPSRATQLRRQAALPEPQALRESLRVAMEDLPFRERAFEPFVADVAAARRLAPLVPAALADTPLAARVDGLLRVRDVAATALVSLTGVSDPQALRELADEQGDGLMLLDLKAASESLVAQYRARILVCLAVALSLLVIALFVALRDAGRMAKVMAPALITSVLVVAILHAAGVTLNLFHLVALVLAAGLGLDYALFFERASHSDAEQRRTLHGVLVCAASTLLVFALLALSSLPVLRAIGVTVALGVLLNFLLALLMTRPDRVAADG